MSRTGSSSTIGHAPFILVFSYICISIFLFWFGPVTWPVRNSFEMAIVQAGAVAFMAIGYLSACTSSRNRRCGVDLKYAFLTGTVLTIALQIPVTLAYTGKYPWDVVSAALDQRATYEEMLEQITSTQGTRFYVPLARSIIAPIFLMGIGYGLLHFKILTPFRKILLITALFCMLDLSLLRGTDKEIADLLIILGGFLLVAYYRKRLYVSSKIRINRGIIKHWIFAAILLLAFLMFFSYRKLERLGGNMDFCMADGEICVDYSGFLISQFPDFAAFGTGIISAYLTNGYYGLSLALEQPFDWTYGIGHSSALLTLVDRFFGDTEIFSNTYIAKISDIGWDHRYYWSTWLTWVASDVHFGGAVLLLGIFSRWMRQAWFDAVRNGNDIAAVVFVLLCMLFLYFPANNQLAQTFDLYFSFVVSLLAWKWGRIRTYLARNRGEV